MFLKSVQTVVLLSAVTHGGRLTAKGPVCGWTCGQGGAEGHNVYP